MLHSANCSTSVHIWCLYCMCVLYWFRRHASKCHKHNSWCQHWQRSICCSCSWPTLGSVEHWGAPCRVSWSQFTRSARQRQCTAGGCRWTMCSRAKCFLQCNQAFWCVCGSAHYSVTLQTRNTCLSAVVYCLQL